jgi:SRSO17 transposase
MKRFGLVSSTSGVDHWPRWACEAGLPRGVVIIDAGYGVDAKFRNEISALKLTYVAGVESLVRGWCRGASSAQVIEVQEFFSWVIYDDENAPSAATQNYAISD